MFIVKEIIYGLGGETWENRIESFKTEDEAQKFVDFNYISNWYVEEEED